jgi:hypothetical protein
MKDPFVRKWFDYLAFALSGVDASNTQGKSRRVFFKFDGRYCISHFAYIHCVKVHLSHT